MPSIPNWFTAEDEALMWPERGADGPFFKSWSMTSELEGRYKAKSHPGTVRLMGWLNEANMATYSGATTLLDAEGPSGDWSDAPSSDGAVPLEHAQAIL